MIYSSMNDDNSSLSEEMLQFLQEETIKNQCQSQPPLDTDQLHCPAIYDGLLCWNYTWAGQTISQHCPALQDFNISALAYKTCLPTGQWLTKDGANQSYTDYMACVPKASYSIYIYFVGYSLSILALVVSLTILFYFKQLNCDRITLHKNLFACNLINSTFWLLYFSVLALHSSHPAVHTICQTLYLVVSYTGTATSFWMLSEGLYLLLILIFTFNKGQLIIRFCILLGWGFPLVIVTIFGSLRYSRGATNQCHLESFNSLIYILLAPTFFTIILNILFMLLILGILFNKLRNNHNVEQHQGQKAAKAILILTPVMGLHSLLLLVQPDDPVWLKVHNYVSALTVSLQGFLVAMPFCFFNSEIHEAIRVRRQRLQFTNKPRFANNRHPNQLRMRSPPPSVGLETTYKA